MIITFGKHSGKDTNLLAKSPDGREYLRWGAENLKSSMWKNEFSSALGRVSLGTMEEQAQATCKIDPEADYDDILYFLRDEAARAAEDDALFEAVKKLQDAIFIEWSAKSGKSIGQLQEVFRRFENWESKELNEIPLSQFSSPAAKAQMIEFVGKLQKCWDAVK